MSARVVAQSTRSLFIGSLSCTIPKEESLDETIEFGAIRHHVDLAARDAAIIYVCCFRSGCAIR
jgi:hypothetical protein